MATGIRMVFITRPLFFASRYNPLPDKLTPAGDKG
jgi:hypothetical protein